MEKNWGLQHSQKNKYFLDEKNNPKIVQKSIKNYTTNFVQNLN